MSVGGGDHFSMLPSCGQTLLRGPRNSFDYLVRFTSDGKQFAHVQCHRCVLCAHSATFNEMIVAENFWDMDVHVKPGYVGAAVQLIQYMYKKEVSLISDKEKVLELCGLFRMPQDHFLIRQAVAQPPTGPCVTINIVADESTAVVAEDFIGCLKFVRGRMVPPMIQPVTVADEVVVKRPRPTPPPPSSPPPTRACRRPQTKSKPKARKYNLRRR
jgi:hypothetical protein